MEDGSNRRYAHKDEALFLPWVEGFAGVAADRPCLVRSTDLDEVKGEGR